MPALKAVNRFRHLRDLDGRTHLIARHWTPSGRSSGLHTPSISLGTSPLQGERRKGDGPMSKMKRTDVSTMRLRQVIAQLPDTFRTKHVSTHPELQNALRRHIDNPRFHQIIGMRLSEKAGELGICCIDHRPNATWQKLEPVTEPTTAPGNRKAELVDERVPESAVDSDESTPVEEEAEAETIGMGTPAAPVRPTDLFLNENLNHPENRINVALFGLMTQDWLRIWFLDRLRLPIDAIVYPPTNESGVRPDLKVATVDGTTLAWIEVELGTNPGQVENYRGRLSEPIKTVYGRRSHGGDLSLEEIADRLGSDRELSPQVGVNVQHLHDQIRQGLSGFKSSSSVRAEVSDEMRDHPLVAGLVERLGNRMLFTTGSVPVGYLKADTNKKQGFSLRANSRSSTSGPLSLLFITGGRPTVYFPSRIKLDHYLPSHGAEIAAYAEVLDDLGCDIGTHPENGRPSLPLNDVVAALDQIAACVAALADRPNR